MNYNDIVLSGQLSRLRFVTVNSYFPSVYRSISIQNRQIHHTSVTTLKMSSKTIFNTFDTVVSDAVEGFLLYNPNVKRVGSLNIIVRSDIDEIKQTSVSLISGGGSGHEPAHGGFVGQGILSAAVLGNVFASPSVSMILAAIRVCAGPKGILLIVKNYTGDRLNFGIALEKAKQEGINIKMVIVDDDSALPCKGITGGRGLAGTVFVHKIAGALAEKKYDLDSIYNFLQTSIIPNMRTLGVALSTCTIPGTVVSERLAASDTFEVGLGIHGEPGREQMKLPTTYSAKLIAKILVKGTVTFTSTATETVRSQLLPVQMNDKLVLLINNLGGLPLIELQIVIKEILLLLKSMNLSPVRVFVGPFVTSLEMSGLSLTVLKLDDSNSGNSGSNSNNNSEVQMKVLECLDSDTSVTTWIKSLPIDLTTSTSESSSVIPYDENEYLSSVTKVPSATLAYPQALHIIQKVCNKIIEIEPLLTQYDQICGDGDCGLVMKAGATAVLRDLIENTSTTNASSGSSENSNSKINRNHQNDASLLCDQIANSISSAMGGTSGIILEIFFRAMSSYISKQETLTHQVWIDAYAEGLTAIQFYGGATEGMRTMLDAMIPASRVLQAGGTISEAATAAEKGAEATKTMGSLAGRSNYINQSTLQGTPDPGAVAVAQVFAVIAAEQK